MENLVGVVNKPQFDTNIFSEGKAIRIVGRCGSRSFDRDCIIQRSTPLSLKVIFINNDKDVDDMDISISEVTTQNVRLRLLKEEK